MLNRLDKKFYMHIPFKNFSFDVIIEACYKSLFFACFDGTFNVFLKITQPIFVLIQVVDINMIKLLEAINAD